MTAPCRYHRFLLLALLFQLISPTLSFCQDQYLLAKADSLYRIGEELFSTKEYDKAIESFSKVLELISKAGEEDSDLIVNNLEKLGDSQYYLGDYSTALEYYLRKIRIVEKTSTRDDAKWAQCLNDIGLAYYGLGDTDKVLEYLPGAVDIWGKTKQLTFAYFGKGDYASAGDYGLRRVEFCRKTYGEENENYATSLNTVGTIQSYLDDYAKALEKNQQALETSSFMLDGESKAPKEDKALTRSGILFAGAQNAFEGKNIPIDVEDGILTAKDISRMDLRGTDLVVISACQSGLGEVTGDGVFGLHRGFKKAGVQSIVMSLWEVSDEATKIMMTRFYENLAKGKSKYDSFREAQKYLRKYDGGIYDKPEYYAAFVLLDAIK